MRTREILTQAAALLQEDATAEQESCAIGEKQLACPDCTKDRDGKCQPMRNVEERRKAAAGLLVMVEAA